MKKMRFVSLPIHLTLFGVYYLILSNIIISIQLYMIFFNKTIWFFVTWFFVCVCVNLLAGFLARDCCEGVWTFVFWVYPKLQKGSQLGAPGNFHATLLPFFYSSVGKMLVCQPSRPRFESWQVSVSYFLHKKGMIWYDNSMQYIIMISDYSVQNYWSLPKNQRMAV